MRTGSGISRTHLSGRCDTGGSGRRPAASRTPAEWTSTSWAPGGQAGKADHWQTARQKGGLTFRSFRGLLLQNGVHRRLRRVTGPMSMTDAADPGTCQRTPAPAASISMVLPVCAPHAERDISRRTRTAHACGAGTGSTRGEWNQRRNGGKTYRPEAGRMPLMIYLYDNFLVGVPFRASRCRDPPP